MRHPQWLRAVGDPARWRGRRGAWPHVPNVRPGATRLKGVRLPLGEWDDGPVARAGVLATWPDQPATAELLFDVGHVPGGARGGKDAGEQIARDAKGVVQASRVVVDVWVQPEAFGGHGSDLFLDLGDPAFAVQFGHLAGQFLQDARAWVPRLVDSVAHAWEAELGLGALLATG